MLVQIEVLRKMIYYIIGLIIVIIVKLYFGFNKPLSDEFKSEILCSPTPEEFVNKYGENGSYLKGGTLCFYGHWFGRPHDNFHELKRIIYENESNILRLTFSENEVLTIYNPVDISEYPNRITIKDADKINWQWYSYGEIQIENNLFYIEITRVEDKLIGKTNTTWYEEKFETLDPTKPAILWIE